MPRKQVLATGILPESQHIMHSKILRYIQFWADLQTWVINRISELLVG
jgi:hypothetical protein